jgi:hypothetical protein
MQSQGLDTERITTFTLQFGNKLYTSIDTELE